MLTHQTVPNQKCQSNERETLCTEAQIPSKMGLVRQDPRAQRAEGKFTQFVSYPWKNWPDLDENAIGDVSFDKEVPIKF